MFSISFVRSVSSALVSRQIAALSPLTLIGVPFHLGIRAVGMGGGPLELLADGAVPDRLRRAGHDVEFAQVGDPADTHEIGRVFELNRELAAQVRAAREAGRLPLIVAGNCNSCLGAIGGINAPKTGIVWVDAHPDFHTPESTESGFLDGMALTMATGACWRTLSSSIPGFHPVQERDVILVGVRDVDPGEKERLESGQVAVIRGDGGPGTLALVDLERAIAALAERVEGVYLHLDFDSIDPSLGRANEYAVEGGLSLDDVRATASAVARRLRIHAASFTAYNPETDRDHRFRTTAVDVVAAAVESSLDRASAEGAA